MEDSEAYYRLAGEGVVSAGSVRDEELRSELCIVILSSVSKSLCWTES